MPTSSMSASAISNRTGLVFPVCRSRRSPALNPCSPHSTSRGGWTATPVADLLPRTVPTDFDARNRFLNYQRDTAIPHHQLKWKWVAGIPFGQNHLLARNAGKFLNTLIGGWQLAGSGTYQSRYFTLPTSNYGPTGNL